MISTRKDEIAALVALLESGEHETAEELAKAVFRKSAEILSHRDSYGVAIGLRTDDMRIPHGPFFTIMDAKRTVREAEARGLVAFIAPLVGAGNALREEEIAQDKRCVCGHPKQLHGMSITPRAVTTLGCCVYKRKEKCSCQSYTAA